MFLVVFYKTCFPVKKREFFHKLSSSLVQRSFFSSLKIQLFYLASCTVQTALFNMCCISISTLQVLWNFNQKCSHVTVRFVFLLLPSYCSTWVWTMLGGGELYLIIRISDTGNLPIRIKNNIYWNSYFLFRSSIQASLQRHKMYLLVTTNKVCYFQLFSRSTMEVTPPSTCNSACLNNTAFYRQHCCTISFNHTFELHILEQNLLFRRKNW